MRTRGGILAVLAPLLLGCPDNDGEPERSEVAWPELDCDGITPSHCMLPFPSNVFTVTDPSTPTGRRVALKAENLPINFYDVGIDPAPWNELDGFSTGLGLMTHLPNATLTGLAGPFEPELSLEEDHPTVVIDAETGERVPHYVELDQHSSKDNLRAFIIRPVVRPKDGTRYIVAIRNVVDADGVPLPASDGFAALRDYSASADPGVGERRKLYADIFKRLLDAGIMRDDLQLAWDFTTSSQQSNTTPLLHMRDIALGLVGPDGPEYTIESIEENPMPEVRYKIIGHMTVPLFLDQTGPGANMIRDANGLPKINPAMPEADFQFTVWIPPSAEQNQASLAQYGHGLFSDQNEPDYFETPFSAAYNYVLFSVDWIGFAREDDEIHAAAVVDSGRFEDFSTITDRSHQGIINHLLAMRMMMGRFSRDEAVQMGGRPAYDPARRFYYGSSQGGILGGVYMALSTDVTRGMLDTCGQPYNLLLPRSRGFDRFFDIIKPNYDNPLDQMLLLSMAQMLWDRVEPNGFTAHIQNNLLPNTPAHEVMIRPAIGDHNVTTLGAHIMARTVGAVHYDTGLRDVYGLEKVEGTWSGGSVLVEYDFGLPPEPEVEPAAPGVPRPARRPAQDPGGPRAARSLVPNRRDHQHVPGRRLHLPRARRMRVARETLDCGDRVDAGLCRKVRPGRPLPGAGRGA